MSTETLPNLIYYLLLLVFIGSGALYYFKENISHGLFLAGLWILIFIALTASYNLIIH